MTSGSSSSSVFPTSGAGSVDLSGSGLDWLLDLSNFCHEEDDSVECGCCFDACAFRSMVQCQDGHLFCTTCLRRHVENAVFGNSCGHGPPQCLATSGCECAFPWTEVRKCFSDDEWLKYEQRRAEDAVAKANLGGLVYCFHCKHPWQVDPEMNVFTCLNENCLKVWHNKQRDLRTCLKCKEADHSPEPCRSSSKDEEDRLRTEVEESMTRAVIRTCNFCNAKLLKNEGCNKIVCRCGQKMCYVCRKDIEDYSHFCQHIRSRHDLGAPCKECTLCCLWTQDDERKIVQAAKSAALEKLASHHPDFLKRKIGPSEETKDRNRHQATQERKRWR